MDSLCSTLRPPASTAAETDPMSTWPGECGTGPDDPEYGINWRHLTLIAPEYGTNTNHTGYVWTIDAGTLPDGTTHEHHYIPVDIFSVHTMVIQGLTVASIGRTIMLEIGLPTIAKFGVTLNGSEALLPKLVSQR